MGVLKRFRLDGWRALITGGSQKAVEPLIPMGRLGEPDELDPLAGSLASDASR
jgi:hypothetical protein